VAPFSKAELFPDISIGDAPAEETGATAGAATPAATAPGTAAPAAGAPK
jgi:hypothetical protein